MSNSILTSIALMSAGFCMMLYANYRAIGRLKDFIDDKISIRLFYFQGEINGLNNLGMLANQKIDLLSEYLKNDSKGKKS